MLSVEESLKLAEKELSAWGEILVGDSKKKTVWVAISKAGVGFPLPSWYVHVHAGSTTTKSFWRYKSALEYFNEIIEKFGLKLRG